VETDHQDLERACGGEGGGAFAEEADKFVVDDFDDLLARGDALEDFLADALLLHAVDEFADDFEMDVGAEESRADLFEGLGHVFFREFADATEVAESVAEFFGERFEHGRHTDARNSGGGNVRLRVATLLFRGETEGASIREERVMFTLLCDGRERPVTAGEHGVCVEREDVAAVVR